MTRMERALVILTLLGVTVLGRAAAAHEVRPAYLEIEESAPGRFDVLWKQPSRGPLMLHLEPRLSNGLLDSAPDEQFSANSFVIRHWKNRPLEPAAFDSATLRIEGLERSLTDTLVNIRFASGQQIQTLLKPANPVLRIRLTGAGKLAVPAYLTLGIEHILTGFDHLSFVLGLVLLVRGRLRLVATITAFTLAHSITLAVAALGFVQLNPVVIESLVALSIVFVAVELTRSWKGHGSVATRYPWLIAFTFGLLHGFAFASSLVDIGLPAHNIPGALLLFNCGVEIGQLLFIGAVLGLMVLLRRLQKAVLASYGRWSVAYGIGALASYWMFARIDVLIQ